MTPLATRSSFTLAPRAAVVSLSRFDSENMVAEKHHESRMNRPSFWNFEGRIPSLSMAHSDRVPFLQRVPTENCVFNTRCLSAVACVPWIFIKLFTYTKTQIVLFVSRWPSHIRVSNTRSAGEAIVKSYAEDKDQVVLMQTLPFQGDLPCHTSNASNKAFSKAASEPSRCGHMLAMFCTESARPQIVLSRSWPGG